MKQKSLSKGLVIDTDILIAASKNPNERATVCRVILNAILMICHKSVLTNRIKEEHDEKADFIPRWSRQWLTKMSDKGKILEEKDLAKDKPHSIIKDINAFVIPNDLVGTDYAQERMIEDEHLIEAALWSDRKVLSMDDRVRGNFSKLSEAVKRIQKIIWINPEREPEECLSWLKAGAPIEEKHYLNQN